MSVREAALRFSRSLRGRLVLSAAVFVVLSMVVVGLVIGHVFERFVRGEVEARLEAQISAVAAAIVPERPRLAPAQGAERRPPGLPRLVLRDRDLDRPPFDRPRSGWSWRIEGAGDFAGESRQRRREAEAQHLEPDHGDRRRRVEAPGSDGSIVRSRRIAVAGQEVVVTASAPREAIDGPLRDASLAVALPIGLCGIMLLGAIALQVRFGLAPLEGLRASLVAVRAGERDRVPDVAAGELRPLVDELNALIDQDAANLKQARRHVANLAHGLKTPLATLSAALERMPEIAGRRDLAGSVELMDRRIRHHLRRARAAALDGHARHRTDLATHAGDLGTVVRRLHAGRGIEVSVRVTPDLAVAVEPEDLDEMLGNLLDNACRHAASMVALTARREGRLVSVCVADDGAGLGDTEIEAVMQPGRRLDETSPGHGFGLPITSELAELYGGSLRLRRNGEGGLDAILTLPASGRLSPGDANPDGR